MKPPQFISLDEAVYEIKFACDDNGGGGRSPFFFLVGSGISYPPVLLATGIIQHCQEKAVNRLKGINPPSQRPIDVYSHWFRQAYPHSRQRQIYLRKLIENQRLSHANLRLAHLLLEKRITSIVVTSNFDDFLSRALTLFGKPHIVCDHPRTVERIDPEQDDVQIIHVHGTYWFYDCANLRGEIEDRAASSPETTLTMAALLDRILSHRAPLVVGYSGWEGDVIMSALKRRLQHHLPYNLYWFCYQRSNVDILPEWLTRHPEVYFVVASEEHKSRAIADRSGRGGSGDFSQQLETEIEVDVPTDRSGDLPALPAQSVFAALIRAFNLPSPSLTQDPLRFLVQQLRGSLLLDDSSAGEEDIYFLRNVIDRIEGIRTRRQDAAPTASTKLNVDAQLEPIRDALRRSRFQEVIQLSSSLTSEQLRAFTVLQLRELDTALSSAASALSGNSEEELQAYELIIAVYQALESQVGASEITLLTSLANALNSKGGVLRRLDRQEEAIAAYEEVVRRVGDSTDPALQEQVARALYSKGIALGRLERQEEAIAAYEEVIRRFGVSAESALQESVAGALYGKGGMLGRLERYAEAIAACEEVGRRFGDSTDPALQESVARALYNKGIALGRLDRQEEAIAACEEVVRRFGDSTDPALQESVARTLHSKGGMLGRLERQEEAIAAYEELVRRFGESSDPALQEQVARAKSNLKRDD